jgi:hypothetical protein
MGNGGVDHLQEFVLSCRVLVQNIFGLVDHLDEAILLSHHFIFLALDLDVRVRLRILIFIFFIAILLRLTLVALTNFNFFEDNIVQYFLIDQADFAQR